MLCCPLLGWAPEVYHFHLPWSAERSWVDQTPVREGDIYCVVVIQSDLQSRMPSTQEQVTLVGSLSSPLPATLGSKLPLQPTRRWSGVELGTCGKLESALRTEPPRCWFRETTPPRQDQLRRQRQPRRQKQVRWQQQARRLQLRRQEQWQRQQ